MLLDGGVENTIARNKFEYHWVFLKSDLCVGAKFGKEAWLVITKFNKAAFGLLDVKFN